MDNTFKLENKVEEPKVGMMFNTVDEAKEHYRRYGNESGFSIKKRSSTSRRGVCKYVVFECNLSGFHESAVGTLRKRPSSRTGCKAKLTIILCPDGKWKVTVFNCDHNHTLRPGGSRLGRWGRRRKSLADRKLELNETTRRLQLGHGDASAIQHYFTKMQATNSNFFYMMDLDDEGYLRNIFWSDARSRAACEDFGDCITFDTSYITNGYATPFALFLGVNHHGQPTLLGCGLVSCEDTETFTWLFQCWLACMSSSAPKVIVTYQCKAVEKAAKIVFPKTLHRWCLRHIMNKLHGNMRGHKQYDSIKLAFQNVVYGSLTNDEFEERWNRMTENYNLHSNEWFLGLYSERHRWVPIYLKDTFCAGMSTQRIESVNAFFDGFVNTKTTIKQFVEQYENAMRKKVQKEKQEDINSSSSVVSCITHYAMEKQFQDAYTATKFKEFQHELRGKMYCEMSLVRKDGGYSEYEISEHLKVREGEKYEMFKDLKVREGEKYEMFKVSLTHGDCEIHCSCCLFGSKGILCRHAIVVLIHNKILSVPEKYIIQRWRKDQKRCHNKVKVSYDNCNGKPQACRFDKLRNGLCEIADLSSNYEDKTKIVLDWINEIKKELKGDEGIWRTSQPTITASDQTTPEGVVLPSLKRKKSKAGHTGNFFGKPNRVGVKRKNNTKGDKTQESQTTEGAEIGNQIGSIFLVQESVGSQANVTLFGVPHQPGIMHPSIFAPPGHAYGRGFS